MWDKCYAEWKKIKELPIIERKEQNIPFYEIGAIEWYGSFSGRGFPGGYAKPTNDRNPYVSSRNTHEKESKSPLYQDINFICGDYKNIIENIKEQLNIDITNKNVLFYFDSPYKNTKAYGISPHFDFEEYYIFCRELSYIYPIFISEASMPEDFSIVWEKTDAERTVGEDNHFQAIERLYLIDNRNN